MLREKEPNGALEQALGHLYQSEDVPAGYETGWRAAVKTGGEQDETRGKQHKTSPSGAPSCRRLQRLVLVVGSLWAGTLDLDLSAAPSEKNAMTETESAGSATHPPRPARPNAMMARSCRYGHI